MSLTGTDMLALTVLLLIGSMTLSTLFLGLVALAEKIGWLRR